MVHKSPSVVSAIGWLFLAVQPPIAGARATEDWATRVVELRGVPDGFSVEGRPGAATRHLIAGRFEATAATMHEVDSAVQANPRRLWIVLGIVKDPATIPWLREKLDASTSHRELIYTAWLGPWQSGRAGTQYTSRYLTYKWLSQADRDLWRPFLIELYRRAADESERLACLRAIANCFHDPSTIGFFKRLEQAANGRELSVAQSYLYDHGEPINEAKLRDWIDALRGDEKGRAILCYHARGLRHETFVPALIELLATRSHDAALSALQRITFETDVRTKRQWEAWWKVHGQESRAEWIQTAARKLERVIEADPRKAAEQRAIDWHWQFPELAPQVERWLKFKELHPQIGIWIVRSYREHDRGVLSRMAEQLRSESWNALWPGTRKELGDLELLPGAVRTWEDCWGE